MFVFIYIEFLICRVLVTGASGGVGVVAIQVCLFSFTLSFFFLIIITFFKILFCITFIHIQNFDKI